MATTISINMPSMNNIAEQQQQPMANRLSVPLCKHSDNNMNTTTAPTNRHRLQSSSSCYSYISNASSTRTHRRCSIEVGSVLFANDNNSRGEGASTQYHPEHTTTMDTYMKIQQVGTSSTTQESYSVYDTTNTYTQEMRSPANHMLSPSASSQIRVSVDDNPLAWLASPFSKSSSRKEEEEAGDVVEDSTTQAVVANLIKELSFDFSSPRDVNCVAPNKNTVTPSSPSNDMGIEEEPISPPLISRIGMEDPISTTGEFPVQVMHNRNRARSTSISEMSASYLNELFNTAEGVDDYSSSTSSSLTCEENDEIKNEKKTIECSMPQQLGSATLTPRCHPVSLWNQNRGRSLTIESDISSYISSESSRSSEEEEEQEDEQVCIIENLDDDDDNLLIRQDSGNLSLQDDTYHTVEVDNNMVLRPRLTEENLREWNVICEEEYSNTKQSIVTKDQFLFRTLSCPYKMNTLSYSPRQVTDMEYSDIDSEVEEPHLLAGISQTISPSLFSYTNSATSDHQDESELNMELEFLHSTLESSSSSFLASKPVCTPRAADGCKHTTKPTVRHRRFKSEPSQIFCNKKIHALPQVNLTFSGVMPSSLKKKPRHQRGQSLCSLPSSHFFDSSLHCILEEASNSTTSTYDPPLFDLIGFIKQHLETLSTSQVFRSGFVMGLIVGLLVPLIFKYMFSRIKVT